MFPAACNYTIQETLSPRFFLRIEEHKNKRPLFARLQVQPRNKRRSYTFVSELTYMMLNPQPVRHHGDEFRIGRLGFAVADRITE